MSVSSLALKTDSMNRVLKFQFDSNQCQIASEAWISMNGENVQFMNALYQCCGKLGIQCDDQGNIVELIWSRKGLKGALSSKLGALPRLERLYDLFSVI